MAISFEKEVPPVTGFAESYLKDRVSRSTVQVLKKLRRKGLIPDRCVWKVELTEGWTHIWVNAYSPGVYCLPGRKGCDQCGQTYKINVSGRKSYPTYTVYCGCGVVRTFNRHYKARQFISV